MKSQFHIQIYRQLFDQLLIPMNFPFQTRRDNQDTDDLDNELLEYEQHDKTYEDDMLNQKFSNKELNDLVSDFSFSRVNFHSIFVTKYDVFSKVRRQLPI